MNMYYFVKKKNFFLTFFFISLSPYFVCETSDCFSGHTNPNNYINKNLVLKELESQDDDDKENITKHLKDTTKYLYVNQEQRYFFFLSQIY